jgi:hypothetical protein
VRREHLVPPWIERAPGMFETTRDFAKLADGLVQRWGTTLDVACGLGRRLARYAEPFQPERFMVGLRALSA